MCARACVVCSVLPYIFRSCLITVSILISYRTGIVFCSCASQGFTSHQRSTPLPTTHTTSAKLSYNWRLIVSRASMRPHIPIAGLLCLSIWAECDDMYVPFSRNHLLKSPCQMRLQPHPPISATVCHAIVAGWLPIPSRSVP